ncbi:MAG: D-alanyl-D-alanine carboxypeptidase family protein [Actinobacteria bacterium]|nr:D-alanyl-D-alanine carboxypeptidase family protein [Actinomycetota bacterium]
MGDSQARTGRDARRPAPLTTSNPRRGTEASPPVVRLLQLQQRAGNAAVGALVGSTSEPPGAPTVQRKKKGRKGVARYAGPKLSVKLREMQAGGSLAHGGEPIPLSESDIFLLQSVANVESRGQVAGVNTWDNQYVSMGFKQVVLGWGSLYDVIRMAPSAFARHDIRIGSGEYAIRLRGKTVKQPKIEGADDPEELRTEPWPTRFLEAGLDDEIISALVVYALQDERELYGKVGKKVGKKTHPYMNDPTVRAWLFQAYNNRPAFAVKAAAATIRKTTGKDLTRDEFLDVVADAIRAEYRKRKDKPERGGNEEWKANNIIRKIPRSGTLAGGKLPPRVDQAPPEGAKAASGPPASADLLGLVVSLIGSGLGTANTIAGMLGLPDLATWMQTQGLDTNNLTNLLFFARHPELNGRRIRKDEPHLAKEWLSIRDGIAKPFLRDVARTDPAAKGGTGGTAPAAPAGPTPAGPAPAGPTPAGPTPSTAPTPPGHEPGAADPGGQAAFVKDAMRSTLELLPEKERKRFEGIEWGWLDYPGRKSKPISSMSADEVARYRRDASLKEHSSGRYFVGKHQDDADALFLALMRVRPGGGERRANLGPDAVLTKARFAKDQKAYDDYISSQLATLEGQGSARSKMMNKHAADKFAELYAAAKADGVVISVRNAFRDRSKAEAAAKRSDNPKAVASFSAHSMGLAMDLNLWTSSMSATGEKWTETSTGNFKNIMRMTASPAYKWMFTRGAEFGFYQYRREPWHWEFNPSGFKAQFFADAPHLGR